MLSEVKAERKTIVIVDGHNLLFRMFYGIPNSIKNSKGLEIKGLIGFIGSIKKLATEFNPFSIIVIFDSETSRFNNEQIEETYKANRKDYTNVEESDNPFSQLPLIKKALEHLNISNLEVVDNEADDYIASIIKSKKRFYNFIIVSTDTDFFQLIDKNVFVYAQRGKKSVLYDKQLIKEKYGIFPSQYVVFKSLIGDRCDNISGVNGIGKVTASQILSYETIERFIEKNNNQRLINLLKDNIEIINKNQKLILLNDKIDASNTGFKLLSEKVYLKKVREIIEEIGFL